MVIQSPRPTQASRKRQSAARLPIALLLILLTSACAAPSYYVQAAAGQFDLMRQRQPIDDLLADGSTGPELAQRLATAQEILEFGTTRLGLPDSGSYRQYAETGREAVTWIVAAAPEFSLRPRTWCFLFAGCVPYRGYFEEDDAGRFAGKMRERGYDAVVAPAAAYSTLGWFDDPLLDSMLRRGDAYLAATLFHEMAHLALYVKSDAAFSESFAGFVEDKGVQQWLASRGDEAAYVEWRRQRDHQREIDRLFARYGKELERLYGSGGSESIMRERKQQVLGRLCTALRDSDPASAGKDAAADCGLNNASFGLYRAYHGGSCAFESLYLEAEGDMRRFIALARKYSEQTPEARDAWLSQSCGPVAPNRNL